MTTKNYNFKKMSPLQYSPQFWKIAKSGGTSPLVAEDLQNPVYNVYSIIYNINRLKKVIHLEKCQNFQTGQGTL